MRGTTSAYFNPMRYWTDRPNFFLAIDSVDAVLDREDSLSDRYAFILGREMGRLRFAPLQNNDSSVEWRSSEMERGFRLGIEQAAQRGDLYQRKVLCLRVKAYLRNIPVSSGITADYLRRIAVTVCPVSGVELTRGHHKDTDWSIDRLNNSLGYVPGNVCVMSSRVNELKAELSFGDVAAEARALLQQVGPDGFSTPMRNGLLVLEGIRLAALMAAPAGFSQGKVAHYAPFAMAPGVWSTIDSAIAGIHVECARTRLEGPHYLRRKQLFKRLGKESWRTSNRLVERIRGYLCQGTHPADLWFEVVALQSLNDLVAAILANPPEPDSHLSTDIATSLGKRFTPLQHYAR